MRMGVPKHALSLTGEKPVRYEACRRTACNHVGGRYEGVRGHGQGATCLREAAFSLRSYFGEGGPAEAGKAAGYPIGRTQGMLFQHSHLFNDDH